MAFGVMVIGDELLVGKRQDKHLSFAIDVLASGGSGWPGRNTTATTRHG